MDFSVVEIFIPTPLLASAAMATLLATLIFWLVLLLHNRKTKVAPPQQPYHRRDLFVGRNGIALAGPDYDFISDAPATFACPVCHQSEESRLLLYRHVPTNRVITLIGHNCPNVITFSEATLKIGAIDV